MFWLIFIELTQSLDLMSPSGFEPSKNYCTYTCTSLIIIYYYYCCYFLQMYFSHWRMPPNCMHFSIKSILYIEAIDLLASVFIAEVTLNKETRLCRYVLDLQSNPLDSTIYPADLNSQYDNMKVFIIYYM